MKRILIICGVVGLFILVLGGGVFYCCGRASCRHFSKTS